MRPMALFFATLVAILFVVPLASPKAEEAYLAGATYINDVYGFILPLPQGVRACTRPPFISTHGIVIRLRGQRCQPSVSLLGVGGYWSNSEDPQSRLTIEQFCGGGEILSTTIHFGPLPVYRCAKATTHERTYYAVTNVTVRAKSTAVAYVMSLRDTSCDERECEIMIAKVVAEARFLSDQTKP